ncbi:MAG: TIGR02449 family protein [Gammaproteobacteria bacterium]|nr:TIGR02449 family protein [Gammaproteobacteria bacterium]
MDTKDLEAKIDELIHLIDELEQKQESLSADQDAWQEERRRLLEKNELAKTKVEAMIQRLKTLDPDQ